MHDDPKKWTDDEVVNNMKIPTHLNKARQKFSSWSAKIEQAEQQRRPLSPIERRRMEFEAVLDIVTSYGSRE